VEKGGVGKDGTDSETANSKKGKGGEKSEGSFSREARDLYLQRGDLSTHLRGTAAPGRAGRVNPRKKKGRLGGFKQGG